MQCRAYQCLSAKCIFDLLQPHIRQDFRHRIYQSPFIHFGSIGSWPSRSGVAS